MMKAQNILADFIERIKADEYFGDIRVTRAYPDTVKPTLLKKAVVAVGIKSIDIDENSIGQDIKAGSYSVFSNIYVPYFFDKRAMEQIVFRICRDISDLNIVAIEISKISANSVAECFVMKAVFTFNDNLSFGDDDNE